MARSSSDTSEQPSGAVPERLPEPRWSNRVDAVLAGDLVAVVGISTPSGGVLLMPVAPTGLRSRELGTVDFTTSLGFWRKLERIAANPRVAMLYSDRSHGLADDGLVVLVQGTADFETSPDQTFLDDLFEARMPQYFGQGLSGPIWDRLGRVYFRVRVRVTIDIERVTAWECGAPGSTEHLADTIGSQSPPSGGTAPRVSVKKATRRAQELRTSSLGFIGADGMPLILPVDVVGHASDGLILDQARPLPFGGRRAGLFSQTFGPRLKGASVQYHSGWLDVSESRSVFAPHTSHGFTAPFGVRTATLGGSIQASVGLRTARRRGLVAGDRWIGPTPHDAEDAETG